MKRFTMLLGLAVLFLAPAVLADVPKLINFQGILRDGSGNPVPDAVYVIRFRIYDDSTAGANLWEEFDDVQTTNGLFNVRLGDTTDLPNGLFEGSVNRFVGVKVGGDPESAPRTRLISVPYAFHALKSDSAATATVALDLTCTGCVDAGDIDATQVQRRVTGVAAPGSYLRAINQDGSVTTGVDANDTYSAGTGLDLTGNQFSIAPGGVTATEIDATQVQRRVTGVAAPGSFIRAINEDGSVVTALDQMGTASGWTDDGTTVRLTTGSDAVGIGLATPTKKLEVAGSVKADTVFSNVLSSNSPLTLQAPAGTTRMHIDDLSGYVGLGTAAPSRNLHLFENVNDAVGLRIQNPNVGGAAQERIDFGDGAAHINVLGSTNAMSIVNNRTSATLGFEVGGTQSLTISNSGNVGIGTNGPNKKLEVIGSVKADTVFSNVLSSNSPLALQAPAGTTRMFINDANGNVGIGTTNPNSLFRLHVVTQEAVADEGGQIVTEKYALGPDGPAFTGRAARGTPAIPSALAQNDDVLRINARGYGTTGFGLGASILFRAAETWSDAARGTRMSIITTPTGSTTPAERVWVEPDGNIGLGTSTPQNRLDVEGGAVIGATYSGSNAAPTNGLLVQGNVGIGTSAPASELHVKAASLHGNVRVESAGGTVLNLDANDLSSVAVGSSSAVPLNLVTSNAVRMTVESTGDVGIGITTPTTRLQVAGGQISTDAGTAAAPSYAFAGDLNTGIYHPTSDVIGFVTNGSERVRITGGTNGLVGIGTTNPLNYKLDVEASITPAGFNRLSTDGTIISFEQDGIIEGSISVSANTVSYNAFTGSHYGWTEETLEGGELVSLTGINRNSHDNPKAEVIYGIKRSSIPNDPACLGSYLALSEPNQPYSSENPHLVMAVGNGEMWVVEEGQNIQPGDYLISSSTPGHAMKDDEEKYPIGHIVARAAEGVDWGSVGEMTGGRKHKKISVLFGNFVRSNPSTVYTTLENLREIILKQQQELEELKRAVLKDGSSEMAENKR